MTKKTISDSLMIKLVAVVFALGGGYAIAQTQLASVVKVSKEHELKLMNIKEKTIIYDLHLEQSKKQNRAIDDLKKQNTKVLIILERLASKAGVSTSVN